VSVLNDAFAVSRVPPLEVGDLVELHSNHRREVPIGRVAKIAGNSVCVVLQDGTTVVRRRAKVTYIPCGQVLADRMAMVRASWTDDALRAKMRLPKRNLDAGGPKRTAKEFACSGRSKSH